jgi:mannosyl-oligosaccharide glucosidase
MLACRREGPSAVQCKEVHHQLRRNLLSNIVQQFQSPAGYYLWENYDDVDGHGKGTHPFGWTCLLALIALDKY